MATPSWLTGLQFRLILAFTLTLALALAAVGFLVSFVAETETDRFHVRNQEYRIGRVNRVIAHHFAERRDWQDVQPSLEQAGSFYGRRFVVVDQEGRVVGDSHHREGKFRRGRPPRGRSAPIIVDDRPVGFLVLAQSGGGGGFSDGIGASDGGGGGGGGIDFDSVGNSGNSGNGAIVASEASDGLNGAVNDGQISPATPPALTLPGPAAPAALQPEPSGEPPVSLVTAAVKKWLFWAGLAAAAGGILLISLISRRILSPVQALSVAARRLGQGDLGQRVPASGPAEIRRLGDTFNTMAENLQTAEQQRRSLTADVAHELRTPLSNIQGYLDAVHDGLLQPDTATIATLRQQTAHLVALVEDLRLLALAEAGSLVLQLRPESLPDLLAASVEAFRPRADAKAVTLTLELADDLPQVSLDRTRIAQVVGNLLENAIFNTPAGGAVTISGSISETNNDTGNEADGPAAVEIAVSDTGPGIAPPDAARVFERFYRVDPSRARATGGAGLGLTIARQLVQAHGGVIWVESAAAATATEAGTETGAATGASFRFTLPLGRQDAPGNSAATGITETGGA